MNEIGVAFRTLESGNKKNSLIRVNVNMVAHATRSSVDEEKKRHNAPFPRSEVSIAQKNTRGDR